MSNNIICIKLNSGEEIISKVNEFEDITKDDNIDLIEPRVLMAGPQGQLSLGPLMFSTNPDKPTKLKISSISSYSEDVREEIKDGYIQSVSKLVIPNKSILMG